MSVTIFNQDQKNKDEQDKESQQSVNQQAPKKRLLKKQNSGQPLKKDKKRKRTTFQLSPDNQKKRSGTKSIMNSNFKKTTDLKPNIKWEDTPEEINKQIKKANNLSEAIKNEPSTRKKLIAFAPKPIKIHFDSQLPNETIVLMLRQHPATQLNKIIIIVLGLFFPILLFVSPFLDFLQPNYKAAVLIGWYLILSGFALETFLSWFFHAFFITDRRVIDIDFYSMVHKNVTSAKLESLQDVNFITTGVLASLLDYGTVSLQTAGTEAKIAFENVPQPAKVAKIINELIAKKKRALAKGKA